MPAFFVVRLGKDSVQEIRAIDALHKTPATPIALTVRCKQVPTEADVGGYVFLCFGSDNSQGAPTDWVRGLRAMGVFTGKTGGPGYNDPWEVEIQLSIVLPQSITRKDLLAYAPTAYFWCSGIPTVGIEANSQQTIQTIRADEEDQSVSALIYAINQQFSDFKKEVRDKFPELHQYLTYIPPAPLANAGVTSGERTREGSDKLIGSNVIFFGPPGTGKSTEVARRVKCGLVFRTQFHPEYTHADFVGSYRPVVGSERDGSNGIVSYDGVQVPRPVSYFSYVPGPFTLALEAALKTNDSVFLVIEEINRGDCAAIFGEVFQLLDRDDMGRSVYGVTPRDELRKYLLDKNTNYDIAADGKVYLPENLSIIATMNTSDQSLFPMDSAFKRRWHWMACSIDYEQILNFTIDRRRPILDDGFQKWDWVNLLKQINSAIVRDRMEDKQIGPWFIKPTKNGDVSWEVFINKGVFYLWHDVFKNEQLTSDFSPFRADGPVSFGEVQENLRKNGLAAGFRPELLTHASYGG
jgi:hypothetical protein